jgi:phosphoglycerol transferase MdoB-like AlkP superfamily enzyme
MTGLNVRHLSTYDLMVTLDRPTLADRFKSIGYRSVALMPGMKTEWPEGSFYGFDRIYGEKDLDYKGPDFGWWRIPDQYSLAKISQLELDNINRQPLFMFFTTITPHMPFRPTPPYQPDWARLTSDTPFEEILLEPALNTSPDWNNLQPAYADTLAYTFDYLAGYFQSQNDQSITWILIGDHQPPASVSGQDVRWDVPVHIISDNDRIINALLGKGFVEGLQPADVPINSMHQFPVTLLQIFSGS